MTLLSFKALTIKSLVLFFLAVLTSITIISVATIFLSMSNNSVAVDVAGRNRMLSQRMVLYARLYMDGDLRAKQVCQAALVLHDKSVLAMKHGGEAPGIEGKTLSPAQGEAADYLQRAESRWTTYKGHLERILTQPTYRDSVFTDQKLNTINNENPGRADSLPVQTTTHRLRVENPAVKASFDFLSTNATAMLEANDDLVKAYVRQAKATERTIHGLLAGGILLSILVLAAGYRTLNKILFKPLEAIAQSSMGIAKGDYNQSIQYSYQNELAVLATSLNVLFNKFSKASLFVAEFGKGNHSFELAEFTSDEYFKNDHFIQSLMDTQAKLRESDKENKQREWVNVGYAQFGEILRNTHVDVAHLGRSLIVHLTKYLNINQGGIFLVNETDKNHSFLELIGCYAYSREKFITKRVEIGEGLLGEVYLEGSSKYLLEVPNNYIHITSGLGEANPKSILMVPLKLSEQVFGVLELASFHSFEAYQIEFVEKLGESIASTLSTLKTNELTKRLYEQSQQQAEELRAQEEEMRQNMEELQATQEEMLRNKKELEERLEEAKAEKRNPT